MKVKSESEVTQSCPTQRPHGLQPTRLLCPWDFPGKSTGVGCHCLLRLRPWNVTIKWHREYSKATSPAYHLYFVQGNSSISWFNVHAFLFGLNFCRLSFQSWGGVNNLEIFTVLVFCKANCFNNIAHLSSFFSCPYLWYLDGLLRFKKAENRQTPKFPMFLNFDFVSGEISFLKILYSFVVST